MEFRAARPRHNCSVVLWNCNEMLTDHRQQTHPIPQEKDGSKNLSLYLQEIYLGCAGALLWHLRGSWGAWHEKHSPQPH